MALAEFLKQLDELAGVRDGRLRECRGRRQRWKQSRVEFLGAKKGRLKAVQKGHGAGRCRGSAGGRQAIERSQGSD